MAEAADLLHEPELAHRWRLSRRTLQRWRQKGVGPAWLKIGGGIAYRLEDIESYEASVRKPGDGC